MMKKKDLFFYIFKRLKTYLNREFFFWAREYSRALICGSYLKTNQKNEKQQATRLNTINTYHTQRDDLTNFHFQIKKMRSNEKFSFFLNEKLSFKRNDNQWLTIFSNVNDDDDKVNFNLSGFIRN